MRRGELGWTRRQKVELRRLATWHEAAVVTTVAKAETMAADGDKAETTGRGNGAVTAGLGEILARALRGLASSTPRALCRAVARYVHTLAVGIAIDSESLMTRHDTTRYDTTALQSIRQSVAGGSDATAWRVVNITAIAGLRWDGFTGEATPRSCRLRHRSAPPQRR